MPALVILNLLMCQSQEVKKEDSVKIDGDETVPRKYKSIYIHNFENRSYVGELTGELKLALTQKMSLQPRFRLEMDKPSADIWLYGKIEHFNLAPRGIDQFGRTTRYVMTILATVWARPNPKVSQEQMFDKKTVRFDTFYSPEQPPYETEFTARQRTLNGLSDRIVMAVIKGWYSELKSNEELGYDPATQTTLPGK